MTASRVQSGRSDRTLFVRSDTDYHRHQRVDQIHQLQCETRMEAPPSHSQLLGVMGQTLLLEFVSDFGGLSVLLSYLRGEGASNLWSGEACGP